MTMDVMLLRLDAPLMSFGAPMVDSFGVIQEFPARSMLTGLLANALGWDHADHEKLMGLQDRLFHASRCDRRGERIRDFQTVDLGQDFMRAGWTTRGKPGEREGSANAREGTHIRERDLWADAVHTVALTLRPANTVPTLDDLEAALRAPARPLFLGRKHCLPSTPVLLGRDKAAAGLLEALKAVPLLPRQRLPEDWEGAMAAWWTDGEDASAAEPHSRVIPVTDERDWRNQVHVGRRLIRHGVLRVAANMGAA